MESDFRNDPAWAKDFADALSLLVGPLARWLLPVLPAPNDTNNTHGGTAGARQIEPLTPYNVATIGRSPFDGTLVGFGRTEEVDHAGREQQVDRQTIEGSNAGREWRGTEREHGRRGGRRACRFDGRGRLASSNRLSGYQQRNGGRRRRHAAILGLCRRCGRGHVRCSVA